MKRIPTKRLAIAVTAALLLAGGGTAVAYWTAGGSGSGTASAGSNSPITAVQTSTLTGVAPGVAAQTLSGNFTNGNASSVYVASVTASISSITGADGSCDATDFTLSNAVMTVAASIPAGTAQGSWTGATLAFNNKATNQDGCKNAVVHISYTVL
ncbi:MAG: hypothetical protein EPN91_11725 [Salinibacterium sp.]|nr:MAG: hypothetical protein EPN91_11725 [Salinibacterium sp.]